MVTMLYYLMVHLLLALCVDQMSVFKVNSRTSPTPTPCKFCSSQQVTVSGMASGLTYNLSVSK